MSSTNRAVTDSRRNSPAVVRSVLCLALASTALACKEPSTPQESQSQSAQTHHTKSPAIAYQTVDSILPIAEHLRKFQQGLSPTETLGHSSSSIGELVNRLARAISIHDTSELRQMQLSVNEFAYVYYPDSRLSKPPYSAPPELLWGQIMASSGKGERQLLKHFGGTSITISHLVCNSPAEASGTNTLHSQCRVRFSSASGYSVEGNLFGTIVESEGRFKFLSLANRF